MVTSMFMHLISQYEETLYELDQVVEDHYPGLPSASACLTKKKLDKIGDKMLQFIEIRKGMKRTFLSVHEEELAYDMLSYGQQLTDDYFTA